MSKRLLALFIGLAFVPEACFGEIQSKAAVVMVASTGRLLYAKNPDLRLMPASTTKLMTALLALERTDVSEKVTISPQAASASAIAIGLKKGDTVTVETLLNAALIKSANDAAVALAEAVAGSEGAFVHLMNSKAAELGLYNTGFINPNGLPGAGQYITAFDLAELMREAIRHPVLYDILRTRVAELSMGEGKTVYIENTNRLLRSNDELIIGKTGYTREAGHCFVSAKECGSGKIIVALLGSPTRDLLWKETEYLMALGERALNNPSEPVVYLMKSDYDTVKVKNALISKKNTTKKIRKKTGKIAL